MATLGEAELCLIAWGRYVRTGGGKAWPAESIWYRMIKEGCAASHSTAPGVPHMPPIVEITEKAVLKMSDSMRLVCMLNWVNQEPARIIRQKLNIDTRELDGRINAALVYIDNFMLEK